jgi:hypothetical protein
MSYDQYLNTPLQPCPPPLTPPKSSQEHRCPDAPSFKRPEEPRFKSPPPNCALPPMRVQRVLFPSIESELTKSFDNPIGMITPPAEPPVNYALFCEVLTVELDNKGKEIVALTEKNAKLTAELERVRTTSNTNFIWYANCKTRLERYELEAANKRQRTSSPEV